MIGNTIHFKDHNMKDCKGRVLDRVLVEEYSFSLEIATSITNYLVITKPDSIIVLVKPNQIKKVL